MKCLMKQLKKGLVFLLLITALTACGASEEPVEPPPPEPDNLVVEQDVQTYITEILDSDAKVLKFDETGPITLGEQIKYVCNVTYGLTNEYSSDAAFTLIYVVREGEWALQECTVNVKTVLRLNHKSLTLLAGETRTLLCEHSGFSPSDHVSWKSSNPTVASVDNGTVTALQEGQTTITAMIGQEEVDCQIQVWDLGEVTDGAFLLDNVKYQLPVQVSVFEANGWNLVSPDTMVRSKRLSTNELCKQDSNLSFRVEVYNPGSEERPAEECVVVNLLVINPNSINGENTKKGKIDILLPGRISSLSSKETILGAYGEPTSISDHPSAFEIVYNKDDAQKSDPDIWFWVEDDGTSIHLGSTEEYRHSNNISLTDGVWYFPSFVGGGWAQEYIFSEDGTVTFKNRNRINSYSPTEPYTSTYTLDSENNLVEIDGAVWCIDYSSGLLWKQFVQFGYIETMTMYYFSDPLTEPMMEAYPIYEYPEISNVPFLYASYVLSGSEYYRRWLIPNTFAVSSQDQDFYDNTDYPLECTNSALGQRIELFEQAFSQATTAEDAMHQYIRENSDKTVTISSHGDSWYTVQVESETELIYRRALLSDDGMFMVWFDFIVPAGTSDTTYLDHIAYMEDHFILGNQEWG